MNSELRSYINSEQEKDIEYAQKACKRLGLDYGELRLTILREIIDQSRALGKSWTPAAGSRPLSQEASLVPPERDEAALKEEESI